MQIRRMQISDTECVSEIERAIFSVPWSKQGFVDAVVRDDTIFLVAEEDDKILGYIGMYMSMDEGEITNVAVAEDARRKGVGEALVTSVLQASKEQGIATVILEVRVSNAGAIRLYSKNGFKECGVRKGFYDFPKEDAYTMIKEM